MDTKYTESQYPIGFREDDARALGEHLRLRHSVELVGIKHVGISNFLHFFLYHPKIVGEYISKEDKHMFIVVDLNDLVEREVFPLWVLTFKRLVDSSDLSSLIGDLDKKQIASLFLGAIQSRNFFLTFENLRESLNIITKNGIFPTIFFIRFDRIKDAVSEEFLSNLEGLKESTGQKLAYVFTSFRALDELAPEVFSRKSLSVFSHLTYVRGAKEADMRVIFETYEGKYKTAVGGEVITKLIKLCGGHIQYLQIALIILAGVKKEKITDENLLSTLVKDERVGLVSEELWESLNDSERGLVKKVLFEEEVDREDQAILYLIETGLLAPTNGSFKIFSPLFEYFVRKLLKKGSGVTVDFTKKENLLYGLLVSNLGNICERDEIIKTVWPEYDNVGVSDWTIDQLVARLRTKLKLQKSDYSVKTVRTRGYRLVEES